MTNATESQHPLLVTTAWLGDRIERGDAGFVLVDCSEPDAYRRAHIPGAISIGHRPITLKSAANPRLVMEVEEFEPLARRLGISNDSSVILYDDNRSLQAARVWWVFERFGLRDVRVLDGGFNAWLEEGRELTSRAARPEPGSFTATVDESHHCRIGDLRAAVDRNSSEGGGVQIWDVRSEGEWLGTNDRGNARVGHVPGAKWLEWTALLEDSPAGRFRPLDEMREILVGAGIDPEAETVSY
jgi:thiosulfate/3-mercaptopyruvate sulfurtransferase